MPSVADELAALRNRGLAKKEKGKLTTKGGATLSTPAEMDSKIQNNKAQIKKKDEIKASDGAVDLETQYFLERNKKDDVKQPLAAVGAKGSSSSVSDAAKKLNAKQQQQPAGKKKTAPAPAAAPVAPAPATMAPPANPKVEPVDNDDDDDDDVPELEEQADTGIPDLDSSAVPSVAPTTTQNRAEKKTRKMLNKIMGMQPMPDGQIVRVTFKLAQQGIFAIEQPTVYESTISSKSSKTYVVLGEAKSLNQNNQAAAAAKNFQQVSSSASPQEQAAVEVVDDNDDDDDIPDLTSADLPLDETGLDGNDIELVMSQASCSRAKAVKALKENDGDLVNTIMALTT